MQGLEIYKQRRERVRAQMGEGVLVLSASPVFIRNNDVEHEYRQHSDFYYLTGFDEPESLLVITAGKDPKFILFLRPRNREREIWDGPRAGVEGAVEKYGADEAFEVGQAAKKLPELLRGHEQLFFRLGETEAFDRVGIEALKRSRFLARRTGDYPKTVIDSARIIHPLRLSKSEDELSLMRRASEITQRAHHDAMAFAAPGRYEYEVEALLLQRFRQAGAERAAYHSIVGSGANATILHYIKNNRKMEDGDLLLIDAGCEYEYYAADVTRTFPVNGKFSEPQRRLYEIVLEAQHAAIEVTKPGNSLEDMHSAALRVITQGLIQLGLIQGPLELALSEERFKPFFMHRTGHYLGMDVHDVGSYYERGRPRPFEVGHVVTVEPGLYVAEDNQDVPAEYRGIGIRIEDDVAVTDSGFENLSQSIAKSVQEVEQVCAG